MFGYRVQVDDLARCTLQPRFGFGRYHLATHIGKDSAQPVALRGACKVRPTEDAHRVTSAHELFRDVDKRREVAATVPGAEQNAHEAQFSTGGTPLDIGGRGAS